MLEQKILFLRHLSIFAAFILMLLSTHVYAVEPISVTQNNPVIDLTNAINLIKNNNDQVIVNTAPTADGIVRKIEIKSREPGKTKNWVVFALTNTTDSQLDRLIIAPYYRLVGSGIFLPDLDKQRLAVITPSQGFIPERVPSTDADIFSVTLDPGATVTFIAESRSRFIPQLYLWQPDSYREQQNRLTMFYGIVIGIAGLISIFLTILFVIRGSLVFPAAASFAWCILLYLCIDFGFFQKAVGSLNVPIPTARSISEMFITITFAVFIGAYMNFNRWRLPPSVLIVIIAAFMLIASFIAFIAPEFIAAISRITMATSILIGTILIGYFAFHKHDRSIHILPVWVVIVLWLFGAISAATSLISNDLVSAALNGVLVLALMLIAFTVLQHAVASGALDSHQFSDLEKNALALEGGGAILWDWNVLEDHITTGNSAEAILGTKSGALQGAAIRWLSLIHPNDRDKFRTALDAAVEQGRGRIEQIIRMRRQDGQYIWFTLRARPVIGADGEVHRCIGTLVDINEQKIAEERLLQDAIHDNLTGLPNRELLLDRLDVVLNRLKISNLVKPTVYVIDIDHFKKVNKSAGFSVGDAALLTLSRRLSRILNDDDSLGRIRSDEFAIILCSFQTPEQIAEFTEKLRETIRAPIPFGTSELKLSASIGVAAYDGAYRRGVDMLKDAEIAMYHAKRFGIDKVEIFKPTLRGTGADRLSLEADLRRAIQLNELQILYQPIVEISLNKLAGFSCILRWNHPKLGQLSVEDFIQVAEETGLAIELHLHVLNNAVHTFLKWKEVVDKNQPLILIMPIFSKQCFRSDLINDTKAILTKSNLPPHDLFYAISENFVMDSPEFATMLLSRLKEIGIGLVLDEFGTGYSNLAYLQRFTFDFMRIGAPILRSPTKRHSSLLQSILQIAQGLNMTPIADGVETTSETVKLQKIGFHFAQGNAFGEALSSENTTRQFFTQIQNKK